MSKLRTGWAGLSLRFVMLGVLGCTACSELHGEPKDGTETGNPPIAMPFLKEALVALVVTADQVHVTGKPGAATPAAQIEVISALTNRVFQTTVGPDGSFDVLVDASMLDSFEVRTVVGSKKSPNTVYVVPGAAAVGATGNTLSCEQRGQLAREQLESVITGAIAAGGGNTRCLITTDCTTVSSGSVCNDSCSAYAISKVGATQVTAAESAIEQGLCKTFATDGCKVLALPCDPPSGELACVDGVCKLANPTENVETPKGCNEDFDYGTGPGAVLTDVYWYSRSADACLPRKWSGEGGNANRYLTRAACEMTCGPHVSSCAAGLTPRLVCIRGGLAGGCAEQTMACARACTTQLQCDGDPIGNWCAGGFCDSTAPF